MPAFDHGTISDVVLHIRYTARAAGAQLAARATRDLVTMLDTAGDAPRCLMFSLRYDFPTEWAAFVNAAPDTDFRATISRQLFPYAAQNTPKRRGRLQRLHRQRPVTVPATMTSLPPNTDRVLSISPQDAPVLVQQQTRQVFMVLQYRFGN